MLENNPNNPRTKKAVCGFIPKPRRDAIGSGSPQTGRGVRYLYAEAIVGGGAVLLPAGDQGEDAALLQAPEQLQVSRLLRKRGGSTSQGRTSQAWPTVDAHTCWSTEGSLRTLCLHSSLQVLG